MFKEKISFSQLLASVPSLGSVSGLDVLVSKEQ